MPENIANAIGSQGKPVVIKKNVFLKNAETHVELEPADSRQILRDALYNPNVVGRTRPISRPDYKVAIRTGDKNSAVVLDVHNGKNQVEKSENGQENKETIWSASEVQNGKTASADNVFSQNPMPDKASPLTELRPTFLAAEIRRFRRMGKRRVETLP